MTLKTGALENRNFSPRPLHKITLSRRTIEIERKKLQTHEKHHSNRARIPPKAGPRIPSPKNAFDAVKLYGLLTSPESTV
jgi:hypothetical protein